MAKEPAKKEKKSFFGKIYEKMDKKMEEKAVCGCGCGCKPKKKK